MWWWVRQRTARVAAARWLVLGVALALLAALAAVGGSPSLASARPRDTPSISIQIPIPNNGVAQGPVGANLTLSGSGFTDGHTYQLGYTPQGQSCGTNSSAVPTFAKGTVTSANGAFSATVQWPAGAANVNGKYAICALDTTDTTQPPVQSSDLFQVVAASAPSFILQNPSTSAPLQGPPYAVQVGSQVTISGQNFAPGGLTLQVFLARHQIKTLSDLNNATQLNTTNTTAISTQATGDVTATIQMPASVTSGTYYLYLISADTQGLGLPSLMAFVQVTIVPQPTATPQPSPTATPKAKATPTTGNTSGGTSAGKVLGVVGLSLLSLLLLIAGVLLLAGGPRRTP